MVSVEKENAFHLREYLYRRVVAGAGNDPFKSLFLSFLGLTQPSATSFDVASLSLYQRCAIAGLRVAGESVAATDLSRLLGQASKIDSTPRPWVSDVFGVMAVKWLVEQMKNEEMETRFRNWSGDCLPQQVSSHRFNIYERDIAAYIGNDEIAVLSSACIPLFLHYREIRRIDSHREKQVLIGRFLDEFRHEASVDSSTALLSLMIYVFDCVNGDTALIPPNGWALNDLVTFLEHIPVGLKRWTWEDVGRTKGAVPVKWWIANEYHVQNLLYVMLGPIFGDIADEVYLAPVGQKTPRIDIYLPSLHTVIEVKFRKDTSKSFQALISEVAEDVSLYRSDPIYKDARIVSFLWDHTRATQEHAKFKEGLMKIQGMDACVVICAPSVILLPVSE